MNDVQEDERGIGVKYIINHKMFRIILKLISKDGLEKGQVLEIKSFGTSIFNFSFVYLFVRFHSQPNFENLIVIKVNTQAAR